MRADYQGIPVDEANQLIRQTSPETIFNTVDRARRVREQYHGRQVSTCAILNAKSGNCGENCAFCPQSVRAHSAIDRYPLKSAQEMFDAAEQVAQHHAHRFGIVTSGRGVTGQPEQDAICEAVARIRDAGHIQPCASLGLITREFLQRLIDAGLTRYHHNLETARSFYPHICSSRTYDDNRQTILLAKSLGLKVCCGCLFGMGETPEQRVELLADLRELEPDSIPVNFLSLIPGSRLADTPPAPLTPLECLNTLAVARLMIPGVSLRLCGGREKNLRDLQSWAFAAGATAMMIGAYLTTGNRNIDIDMQMLTDLGLELRPD